MDPSASSLPELSDRLASVEGAGAELQEQGLPFPSARIRSQFEAAVRAGAGAEAQGIVHRAEELLARLASDWPRVRPLLDRYDALSAAAEALGIDLGEVREQIENPRVRLLGEPLTPESLDRTAEVASLGARMLGELLSSHAVREGRQLGLEIREARDRGEDVREAADAFALLVGALKEQDPAAVAEHLAKTRRSVARIPRAPALPEVSPQEEEEILREARNLARRLQRIRAQARDASGAVRLMGQVRQVLTERRYGTAEEEVEELWSEVARLAKERELASPDEGSGRVPEPSNPLEPPRPRAGRDPSEDRGVDREHDATAANLREEPAAELAPPAPEVLDLEPHAPEGAEDDEARGAGAPGSRRAWRRGPVRHRQG
jgi:hypothetical protein